MEDAKFQQIANTGMNMLHAAFTGAGSGDVIAYNAFVDDLEVVVLGYQYQDGEHTNTKPLAILVDPDLFARLRVDGESGRFGEEEGVLLAPRTQ